MPWVYRITFFSVFDVFVTAGEQIQFKGHGVVLEGGNWHSIFLKVIVFMFM
jgi:hypothetical protein